MDDDPHFTVDIFADDDLHFPDDMDPEDRRFVEEFIARVVEEIRLRHLQEEAAANQRFQERFLPTPIETLPTLEPTLEQPTLEQLLLDLEELSDETDEEEVNIEEVLGIETEEDLEIDEEQVAIEEYLGINDDEEGEEVPVVVTTEDEIQIRLDNAENGASPTLVSSAVEVLTGSGYVSMGLTLQLANQDLNLEDWQELTIFAPSDQAFSKFGQPSLLDIQYQLSPTRLPEEILRNLPSGANIPTLRSNSSLVVTNSSRLGGTTSINNVVVQDSPVLDDGYIVIYGADEFFTSQTNISDDLSLNSSPSSSIPDPISSTGSIPIRSSATRTAPSPNFASDSTRNLPSRSKPVNIFESASRFLMSRGFEIMATFLALQLETSDNDTKITVFAPVDEAIQTPTTKFSDYATIFRGHVINGLLLSKEDLQKLALEGSILQTVLKGYEIEVSCSGDTLLLNGVPLISPDLYVNDSIAIHGFNQMIVPKEKQVSLGESISVPNNGDEVEGVHDQIKTTLLS